MNESRANGRSEVASRGEQKNSKATEPILGGRRRDEEPRDHIRCCWILTESVTPTVGVGETFSRAPLYQAAPSIHCIAANTTYYNVRSRTPPLTLFFISSPGWEREHLSLY